ncbi:hypothetical protein [Fontibacillus panacisegetis]
MAEYILFCNIERLPNKLGNFSPVEYRKSIAA